MESIWINSDSTSTSYFNNLYDHSDCLTAYGPVSPVKIRWKTSTGYFNSYTDPGLYSIPDSITASFTNSGVELRIEEDYLSGGDTIAFKEATSKLIYSFREMGWLNGSNFISPKEKLKAILKDRLSPCIKTNPKSRIVPHPRNEQEEKARETLRMIIGENQYQRFITKGFVTAFNRVSGYVYQFFWGEGHPPLTHIYKNGKLVERLCIYLKGNFPPTDFIITMYLMALNDDQEIWSIGNKFGPMSQQHKIVHMDERSLSEIFKEIKRVA